MAPRSPLLRAGWLALALVHLVLPIAAEVAEARLVAAEAGAVAHVESEAYDCGATGHSDACVLHHFLSVVFDGEHRAPRPTFGSRADGGRLAARDPRLVAEPLHRSRLPRAPPSSG